MKIDIDLNELLDTFLKAEGNNAASLLCAVSAAIMRAQVRDERKYRAEAALRG